MKDVGYRQLANDRCDSCVARVQRARRPFLARARVEVALHGLVVIRPECVSDRVARRVLPWALVRLMALRARFMDVCSRASRRPFLDSCRFVVVTRLVPRRCAQFSFVLLVRVVRISFPSALCSDGLRVAIGPVMTALVLIVIGVGLFSLFGLRVLVNLLVFGGVLSYVLIVVMMLVAVGRFVMRACVAVRTWFGLMTGVDWIVVFVTRHWLFRLMPTKFVIVCRLVVVRFV